MMLRSFVILLSLLGSFSAKAQNPDIRLLRTINLHRNTSLDRSFNLITNSAAPVSLATPITFWIVGKASHNEKLVEHGVVSGTAVILSLSLSYLTKYSIRRSRPYATYQDIQPYAADNTPSFPSNHTTVAFSTATYLSLAYPKWYVIIPSYGWASAVGYSRLHLGEHYPSDVLGGAILGAGSAFLCYKLNSWIMKQYHRIL